MGIIHRLILRKELRKELYEKREKLLKLRCDITSLRNKLEQNLRKNKNLEKKD